MDIGIGLPNAVPGTEGGDLVEFARRADAAGFSSLGTIDRIVYPNFDPFVALAAAAAVTERIRLMTTILIVPYRGIAAIVAKQAASLQVLCGGRLRLGMAIGGRGDDYAAAGVPAGERGERFDAMLGELRAVWAGEGLHGTEPIGPDVSGAPPEVVIGGSVDAAFQRAAEHGDGWIMGGGTPDMLATGKAKLQAAWNAAGRDGAAYVGALAYYGLGERGAPAVQAYLRDYYGVMGAETAEMIAGSAAISEEMVRGYVQAFEDAGCQELIFFPGSSDPEQVDLLAQAALR